MYDTVPSYVSRSLTQVDIAEHNLPFEPSFGWVGRTDYHLPYTSKGQGEGESVGIPDYDQYRFCTEITFVMIVLCPSAFASKKNQTHISSITIIFSGRC